MSDALLFITQVAPYQHGPAGVHGVLDQAAVGVAQVAELNGLRAQRVDDVRDLDHDVLASARALALFTIGETPWDERQRTTVLGRLRAGELAVASIHSTTDSCYGWNDFGRIVGARFDGHPWTKTVALEVLEPEHPATRHLGEEWNWHDEVYQFRDLRRDARVLLRVRKGQLDFSVPGAKQPPHGFPLAWCFTEGDGRVFSTSLGHFPGAWESPTYLQHLTGGVAWALGEGE